MPIKDRTKNEAGIHAQTLVKGVDYTMHSSEGGTAWVHVKGTRFAIRIDHRTDGNVGVEVYDKSRASYVGSARTGGDLSPSGNADAEARKGER